MGLHGIERSQQTTKFVAPLTVDLVGEIAGRHPFCDLHGLKSGELARELNLLDPDKVWTWDPTSRRPYRGYPKRQLPMWHKYRVELYPHVPGLGIGAGIRDKHGNELEFPSAFRQSRRDGTLRGIVKIRYGGKP